MHHYDLNIPRKVRSLAPPLPAEAPAGALARSRTRVCAGGRAWARAWELARMPSMVDRHEAALLLQLIGICASEAARLFPDAICWGAARD